MSRDLDQNGAQVLLEDAFRFRSALAHYFRRKVNDVDEVDDMIQEVYVRIAARRSSEAVSNLGGYIFQTAASVLADRHRRRMVRHAEDHVPFDSESHGGTDFDAVRILENQQHLKVVLATLDSLPERTRVIFALRRFDGHPYKDIALQIGISVSAVEKHMIRAVQRLLLLSDEVPL